MVNKKAVLSQRWLRNAPYIWVPWKFSGLSDNDHGHGYFSQNFMGLWSRIWVESDNLYPAPNYRSSPISAGQCCLHQLLAMTPIASADDLESRQLVQGSWPGRLLGATLWKHFNTNTAVLTVILFQTTNQWRRVQWLGWVGRRSHDVEPEISDRPPHSAQPDAGGMPHRSEGNSNSLVQPAFSLVRDWLIDFQVVKKPRSVICTVDGCSVCVAIVNWLSDYQKQLRDLPHLTLDQLYARYSERKKRISPFLTTPSALIWCSHAKERGWTLVTIISRWTMVVRPTEQMTTMWTKIISWLTSDHVSWTYGHIQLIQISCPIVVVQVNKTWTTAVSKASYIKAKGGVYVLAWSVELYLVKALCMVFDVVLNLIS